MNKKKLPPAGTAVATAAVIMWAVFAAMLWHNAGNKDIDLWTHETWIFGSVQGIAYAAAGALFGTAVQKDRVQKAETRADAAQSDASNGRALAMALQSDAAPTNAVDGQALAPQGPSDDPTGDSIRQRHAAMARSLFGNMLHDSGS